MQRKVTKMPVDTKFGTKEIAITVCFTALYAVLGFMPLSPILGLPGKTITMAAIMAVIIGAVLGPYLGALSTFLGGVIGYFALPLSPMSFFSGIITALSIGLLFRGRRILCALVYLLLLILFGFYPVIGPAWLFPLTMWFQIIGFIILISPLEPWAVKSLNSNNNSRLLLAFFIISLASTLAGQIAGSLVFEIIVLGDVGWWTTLWQSLTFLYPAERIIIALSAAFISAPLFRILESARLKQLFTCANRRKMFP
jgi:hypothetical protein